MFLEELNHDQSVAFISIVNELANIDNVLAKEEKKLIDDYKSELKIDQNKDEMLSYEDSIKVLNESAGRLKSIVYFELVGLALVDGNYEEKEIDFLDKVSQDLNIARSKRIAFANYFFNFKEIYDFSVVDAESKIKLLKDEAEMLLK